MSGRKEYVKKWNKEHQHAIYLANREKILARSKKYHTDHREQIKKYHADNYKREKELRKKRYAANIEKLKIISYRSNDKKRGLLCDLTELWMKENITSKPCTYCGSMENIGCDRIDNSKGHTQDNCIPCCPVCNMTRGGIFTIEEMRELGAVISLIRARRKIKQQFFGSPLERPRH